MSIGIAQRNRLRAVFSDLASATPSKPAPVIPGTTEQCLPEKTDVRSNVARVKSTRRRLPPSSSSVVGDDSGASPPQSTAAASSTSVERHAGAVRTSLRTRDGEPISHAHPDHDGGVIVLCGFIVALYIALGLIGWVFFH